MDLSAPISYNGLTISGLTLSPGGAPSTGIVVDNVDVSDIDADAYLEKRALHDGLDASDVYLGGRKVTVQASVYGSTIAHSFDQLQAFVRAFNPRIAYNADTANLGFLAFDFRQPTISTGAWTAGYIPLRYYLRPVRPVRYALDATMTGGAGGKAFAIRATAALIARDPRKYVQTATGPLTIATSALTATNRGDYPTAPIITFTMTAAGSTALTFTIGGLATVLNMSTQTSGDWTLDYDTRTLTKAGTGFQGLITSSAGWAEIQPGSVTPYVMLNGGGLSNGVAFLTFRDAFA